MKPLLPHFVTDDEYYAADPAMRREWNARIAAGTEPQEPLPASTEPTFVQLDPLCTWSEYDSASPEQQRDYDKRLLQSWNDRHTSELSDDASWDKRYGFMGE
jgi:hypothetical protein